MFSTLLSVILNYLIQVEVKFTGDVGWVPGVIQKVNQYRSWVTLIICMLNIKY